MSRFTRRLLSFLGAAFSVAVLGIAVAAYLVFYPDSPLPDAWNPTKPLIVSDPVNPVTRWKLKQSLTRADQCISVLESTAVFRSQPDFEHSEQCYIRDQIVLRGVAGTDLAEVNTRCQIGLRMAMWMRHGIEPAAQRHFGQSVARIHHQSSYNCRTINTGGGPSNRMSTHATADAIDVTGFTLNNGRKLMLIDGWNSQDAAEAAFFRDVRDSACDWFVVTLGPDYNALHADHFHLQNTGWGACR